MRAANLLTLAQSLLQLDMQQLIGVRNDPAFGADGPDLSTEARCQYGLSCCHVLSVGMSIFILLLLQTVCNINFGFERLPSLRGLYMLRFDSK